MSKVVRVKWVKSEYSLSEVQGKSEGKSEGSMGACSPSRGLGGVPVGRRGDASAVIHLRGIREHTSRHAWAAYVSIREHT